MRSTWFGLLLAFAVTDTRALAQSLEADAPLWPPDCTRDMPRDGLLLLERSALGGVDPATAQALDIRLQRTSDGALVAGTLEVPEERTDSLLRWRSHAPLQANTEYKVEARPRTDQAPAAQPALLSGYFTTGDTFLAPLAFSGRPAVRLLARAPQQPAAEPAPETVLVRIALPPLTGGLAQRALEVSATWSERDDAEQAAALPGRHAQRAIPGATLAFELEAQLRDAPSERCLEIVARDDLGQELALDPALCVSLPARSADDDGAAAAEPADDADPASDEANGAASFETLASRHGADDATGASQPKSAGGCSLSGAADGRGWAWLIAALPALLLRRRMRFLPGQY